ncbi:MAG: c-type cytochrome [Candidatus Eiseniibacteriota bacterium]
MNTLELNKIVGAVLVAALSATVISQIGNMLVPTGRHVASHGGEGEAVATAEPAKAPAPEKPLTVLLQKADAKEGEKTAKACIACHSFEKGGPNKVGPDLWEIVDRPKAAHEGFNYSDAVKKLGGKWTYQDLFEWLKNPSAYAPGTKMTFHLASPEKRADVLAYLRTLSANPVPLPQPTAEDLKKAEEKPAETKAAAAAPAKGAAQPAQEAKTTEPTQSVDQMLASASVEKGAQIAKRCTACHDLSKDGKNKVGPHLYGVVGRDKASIGDYNYSPGMKALQGKWTFQDLYTYLNNPQAFAKGSKMTFKLTKPDERADVIAYLRTLSDNPVPLPGK